jgi:peptide/nickel transport system substrate-binding protein
MRADTKLLDVIRRRRDAIDNDLIDELVAGHIDRRTFMRQGSLLGLSLPLLGGIAGLLSIAAEPQAARAATTPGGTIRVGLTVPAAAIDPVTIADNGGLELLIQTGVSAAVKKRAYSARPLSGAGVFVLVAGF